MVSATADTKGLHYLELALSKPLEFTNRSRLSGMPLSVKIVLKVLGCSCVCMSYLVPDVF